MGSFKIKGKSVSRISKKLNEILDSKTKEIYGVVTFEGADKIELFHLYKGEVCKKGWRGKESIRRVNRPYQPIECHGGL